MPHIDLNNHLPGIQGLLAYRPGTAAPLTQLTEVLLRGPSPLGRGERELIAAYVSHLNGTDFCTHSHSAFAAAQIHGGWETVRDALDGGPEAPLSSRLQALLKIAREVQQRAAAVPAAAIAAARDAGAGDTEIHDAVLIASAFSMYNRYVACLDTVLPDNPDYYGLSARHVVASGYEGEPRGDDVTDE